MKKLGRISYHIFLVKYSTNYCKNNNHNLRRRMTANCAVLPGYVTNTPAEKCHLAKTDNTATNFKSSKMADAPVDCEFPVWGLLPKKETGVVSFLSKNPEYDGRNTVIAILDSGVDPAAEGLKVTSLGETKVIERYDCSGCGDVDTSTVIVKLVDGCITGLTGRKLKIPESWTNPKGEWRVGVLYPFSLYPTKLKERVQEHRKEHLWDVGHKPALAEASKNLHTYESDVASKTISPKNKLQKEELEARIEVLQNAEKKYNDLGPTYDCVLFHDGTVWRACIDTSECGNLDSGPFLGEFSITHDHTHLTPLDEMTISINVHDEGETLEVVGMCSTHGTHVAAIAAGYFPNEPEKNGVAPGAKVISLTIGDSRLGSMETGTALVRACIKIMELSKKMKVDVINMSYGEHAHWANSGRIGDIICSVVNRYGVSWVVSGGNHGPALCTVGAPPDIAQPVLIGVGAYVSPEMMSAAYSMRARVPGGAYSWSSRGPCADGACGISVCAPGGAVAAVARFTLRNCQLMNGTSMAAPHVAGAVAILMSGLKQKGLPYTPYSVKRALENTATYMSHVEPWAQGTGLLNVDKAFENLSTYYDQPDCDVTFCIQCGTGNNKGILLTPKIDDVPKDIAINIEPKFQMDHEDVDNVAVQKRQISFNLRLALSCDAAWVSSPTHLDITNVSRPISVRVDCAGLPPGAHFTSINAYDVSCVQKGPVFRIPITVLQPEPLQTSALAPRLCETNVLFQPGHIKRHFVVVPADASWGVLRLRTATSGAAGRFLVHAMQRLPRRSCRLHETHKLLCAAPDHAPALPFAAVGDVTLELVIAKYWANLGDITVDYTVEFHGLKPDFGVKLSIAPNEALKSVMVKALRQQEVAPSAVLKYAEPVTRPSESKLSPLTSRDVIPPARQIYQLVNTYNVHVPKAAEVSPMVSLLSDMLYESEFEAQMWMLYNTNKQLMAVGDAYPSKYSVKLEKGDYVVRVVVRHETRALLEKLQDLPLALRQRLPAPLALDVYAEQAQALTGGKKLVSSSLPSGSLMPVYFTGIPTDKLNRVNYGAPYSLTGSVTFAKDELGRKVDSYPLQYYICEAPKRTNTKEKEKTNKHEEYLEAVKEFTSSWIAKLEGDKLEQVYEDTADKFPEFLAAHVAYLHASDPPNDPKRLPHANEQPDVTVAWCEQLISIADKVLKQIDQDKLLAFLGMKNDTRSDASKYKQEQEKQRGFLVDALCRRGAAHARLVLLSAPPATPATPATPAPELAQRLDDLHADYTDLLKFTDITDLKAIHFGIWHSFALGHWGRGARLLARLQDERPSRELDDRLIEAYKQLGWDYMAQLAQSNLPAKYPAQYRPF